MLIARPGSELAGFLQERAAAVWRHGADRAVIGLPGGIESHEASDGPIPPAATTGSDFGGPSLQWDSGPESSFA